MQGNKLNPLCLPKTQWSGGVTYGRLNGVHSFNAWDTFQAHRVIRRCLIFTPWIGINPNDVFF